MRRKEKRIEQHNIIQEILEKSDICRIAFCTDDIPYIVPVNYVYFNQGIYFHSAPAGKKIEFIKKNNKVCFEIEGSSEIIPAEKACNWGTRYRSLIGSGTITIFDNREDKIKGLDMLMKKYSGKDHLEYNNGNLDNMVIIKIDITDISGKQSGNWPE